MRLSKLTLSAIECSNFAPNEAEANRLGAIGIEAGKRFLELVPKLSAEEQKKAGPNIAVLWRGVSGYSEQREPVFIIFQDEIAWTRAAALGNTASPHWGREELCELLTLPHAALLSRSSLVREAEAVSGVIACVLATLY
ncbi:MAG TPA: hypothetical protein VGJ01_14775 [Pseudolabrys sp.]